MPVLSARKIDDSRWGAGRQHISGTYSTSDEVNLHYILCHPPTTSAGADHKGTILLIHGFPQSSYQFRHVITPLSDAGYTVIAPDMRGAGYSSKPRANTNEPGTGGGFRKSVQAGDVHTLLTQHLKITEPVHVVGHDIGGMVAHAYASRFPEATRSVMWGECPLPGTEIYERVIREERGVWHFHFHWAPGDLPEKLIHGREDVYMQHFFTRLAWNPNFLTPEELAHTVHLMKQSGAIRCGIDGYRAFHADAEEVKAHVKANGKCKVPCCVLNGQHSPLQEFCLEQAREVFDGPLEERVVDAAGHWCAEENPESFVREILDFISQFHK